MSATQPFLPDESRFPPAVTGVPLNADMRSYWLARARQHTHDSYMGVPIQKFPEDLRVYEHLLWATRPNVVIEIGTSSGGSALWFRDRLRALAAYGRIAADPKVISIDISHSRALPLVTAADPDYAKSITFVEHDINDPDLPDEIRKLVPEGARCFLIEDSAHIYSTTYSALEGFASFVPLGSYFVVEDGCVDVEEMRLEPEWPRGVLPALHDWLQTPEGRKFQVRRDLERYGMTCHPQGFLQRISN